MNNSPENKSAQEDENDDLYEHFSMVADKGQEPLRIDKYLMNFVENATRNKIQNAAKAGNILVNNETVKPNYRVKPFDEISIVLAHPPRENQIIPENIPLNIVYEDEELIVINKPAGMVVHPGHGNYSGTLVNALTYYLQAKGSYNEDLDRVGLVHRIDKDTSGLLVVAKTEYSMNHLAKQFFNKTTTRKYNALVWGNVAEDQGTIRGYINRDPKDRMQMKIFPDEEQGKLSITHYKVLERYRYVTWLESTLETGRTHQIRASFKSIGHILFNDERYGGDKVLKGTTNSKYKQFVENTFKILPRQALHARTLGFVHPTKNVFMEFEAPLPEDMQNALDKWQNYVQYE